MIKVTRLNKETFLINCDQIESAEETPDTVVTMVSGRKLIVAETIDEIRDLVIEFKRKSHIHQVDIGND